MELQTGKLRLSIEGYFLEDAGAMRDFVLGSHTQTGSFLAADEHRKEEKQLINKAEMFSSTSFAVSKSHTQQWIC